MNPKSPTESQARILWFALTGLAVATVVALSKSDYVAVLDTMSELGLSGGVIYDALAARVAARARAEKLLTLNPRDFRRVWPEGDAIICEP